jgi:cytochrome P450
MATGISTSSATASASRVFPPGPRGLKFALALPSWARNWLGFLDGLAERYGDISYFRVFGLPVCFLNHPELIQSVLVADFHDFTKSKDYFPMRRLLGNGLLTSKGEVWRQQRHLMQPAFHRERIAAYGESMASYCRRMLDDWHDGEFRDLHEDMMGLTLEIVARALFDADVTGTARDVGESVRVFLERFVEFAGLALLIPQRIPTPGNRRLEQAGRRLDKIIFGVIDERRRSGRGGNDLLAMLLEAQDAQGVRMTNQQVRDEVMTLFLAGQETTANALAWTWYLLAKNPECDSAMSAELREMLGQHQPTLADLPRLPYTASVLKESLRLYPPAWGIAREATCEFALGGFHFPKGMSFLVSQWVTHRDARYFPEPSRFLPGRWNEDFEKRLPKFAFFPFGGGPRVCIGAGFAMMEATLVLATVAQRFRLELIPDQEIVPFPSVTLRPRHGVKVKLITR